MSSNEIEQILGHQNQVVHKDDMLKSNEEFINSIGKNQKKLFLSNTLRQKNKILKDYCSFIKNKKIIIKENQKILKMLTKKN